MGFEMPIIIISLLNTLILSLLYFYLYHKHNEKSMGIWALSWLIYASRFPFDLIQFDNPSQYQYLFFTQLTALLSSFLLLWGTYSWIEKNISRWWIGATGLLVLWLFLASWLRVPFMILSIPVFFFSGLVNMKTGFLFLNPSPKSSLSGYIIGGCFFIWGLHKWDYPFLREVPEYVPLGFLLSFLLSFWIGIGFLLLYYERSQRSLQQSEERFQILFDEAPLSYQSLDEDGHIITVNKTWLDTLGYESHEVAGRWYGDIMAPDFVDKFRRCFPQFKEHGLIHNVEFQLKKKDGNRLYVSFDGKIAYDEKGHFKQTHCIFRDITELKKTENDLHQTQQQLQQMIDAANDAVWDWNMQTGIVHFSARYYEILGYQPHELPPTFACWYGLLHPEDRERLVRFIADSVCPSTFLKVEYRLRKSSGDYCWVQARGRIVECDEQGKPLRQMGTLSDISEKKEAEIALAESERRFREMLENVQMVAMILDTNGNIIFANDYLAQITGWNRQELLGKNWFSIFLPSDCREKVSHLFHQGLEAGTMAPYFENEILKKNGDRAVIRWNNTILRTPQGEITGTSSLGEDITRRKELEEQLLQSQKMESLGILAGGIAHDFNNLLTVILWYSQSIRDHAQSDSSIFKEAEEILKAGERASELTRQLLMFSRKQFVHPKHLSLNRLLLNLDKILRRILPENIELTFALDPSIGIIKADANQIEQIVMNMVVNAKDAMPSGGKLDIQTASVYWKNEPGTSRQHHSEGWYVSLRIQDSGCGMDEKTKSRIFDPFFTTKEVGKGTGLGLSTVYGVVEHCQGFIQVESQLGFGATFLIYLPYTEEPIWEDEQQAYSDTLQGNETILLVEDNGNVCLMISSILRKYGYTVHEACNGVEALNRLQSCQDKMNVDLVITDVIMPLMGGKELVEKLRLEHPLLKVLFMSGYSDQMSVSEESFDSPNTKLLQKPFTTESLLKAIRHLLEADEKNSPNLSAV